MNRGHCLWRGQKRKRKRKYVFVDLISSKHFMVSNPFLPQRKFENSSMLSGEQSYKKSYVSVRECGCVCLCVFLQADRLPHFLHSIFALVRPSPKGHIVQMTPASNSQTQELRRIHVPSEDNCKGFELSRSIKNTKTPFPPKSSVT